MQRGNILVGFSKLFVQRDNFLVDKNFQRGIFFGK